jgi:VanZ family protein
MLDTKFRLAWLLLLAALPLFFFGGGDDPVLRHFYDIAHIAYFGILSALLLWSRPQLQNLSFSQQLLLAAVSAILVGGAIELLQIPAHRDASIADLHRDLLGALAGVALASKAARHWPPAGLRILLAALAVALLLETKPMLDSVVMAAHSTRQFPVLSNFEHRAEVRLWSGGSRNSEMAREGRYSLALFVSAATRFSATTMAVPCPDWRGYDTLRVSVYREGARPLSVWVRVLDQENARGGYIFDDRFQAEFPLHGGWNDLDIPMDQIIRGPARRLLNLAAVKELSIYTVDANEPQRIFIDDVRLTR